ncbi:MAG: hypothetical protein ACLPWF_06040 [Bryobacteraceae bacterium]
MNNSWMQITLIATLLPIGPAAMAQSIRFSERQTPAVTDVYQEGENLFYSAWSNLDQAQGRAAPNPGDWYRLDVARGQMELLERTWSDGSYQRSQIDAAISDLQRVLDDNNILPRDRRVLAADLEKLRDNRAKYFQ